MQIVGFELSSYIFMSFAVELALSFIFALSISFIICNKLKVYLDYMVAIAVIILLIPSFLFFYSYTGKMMTKDLDTFEITVYYTNKNNENIKVSKDQIINDIVNDKIENNNENLQVYKQAFQITYDEYNLLKPHEVEYKNQSEYGNVKIIE